MSATIFLALSRALTGEHKLDEKLASAFEQRLRVQFGPELIELIAAFQARDGSGEPEAVVKQLLEDPRVEPRVLDHRNRVARAIVWAWYTGQFPTPFELPDAPQTPEQYSRGLLWHVIGAHAPGFTNAEYAAWAKVPPPHDKA